jgi:Zn-dependent protease
MRQSFRLGRVGGTDVSVHWTVPALAATMTACLYGFALPSAAAGRTPAAYANAAVQIVVLTLASLLVHELAHVLVARRYGSALRRLTILPVGGWSEPDRVATARAGLVVALAGPAVNLLLSGAAEVAVMAAKTLGLSALTVVALTWISAVNIGLALVNVFPVAPLDGARVVRAIASRRARIVDGTVP